MIVRTQSTLRRVTACRQSDNPGGGLLNPEKALQQFRWEILRKCTDETRLVSRE